MSESECEYAANYREPPLHTRFKKGQSGNPRGRPAKNLPALLAAALNEKVTVTEKRQAPAGHQARGGHRSAGQQSASAELRATKVLIDMQGDGRPGRTSRLGFPRPCPGDRHRCGNCQREINTLAWYKCGTSSAVS